MTAHALYFQRTEALIATDSIVYTAKNDPVGFADKVLPIARLRAALFGRGAGYVLARAWATIAVAPQLQTLEDVADALPAILRELTSDFAAETGLDDPDAHIVFEGRLIGWSAAEKRMRFWTFDNYDGFAKVEQMPAFGWLTSPALPVEFQPRVAGAGLSIERQAIELMQAHKRHFLDMAAKGLSAPCLGGEVMLTRITERGVDTRSIWTFPDATEQGHAAAAVAARAIRGDYTVDLNEDLCRTEDGYGPRTSADATAPSAHLSRAERRAIDKRQRKAARRAA